MYDVCIIGGGPAGMYSAFYCASRGLNTLLLEGNKKLGGRLHYYLDMPIYDLPGQYGITAEEYLRNLERQLHISPAQILLNERVRHVHFDQHFTVQTTSNTYEAKTIINATGTGYIQHKKLQSKSITAAALPHISYSLPANFESTEKIAIIGHTPMAIDWAIQLKKRGVDVLLIESQSIQLQPILMDAIEALQIPTRSLQHTQIDYHLSTFSINDEPFSHVFCHIGTTKESFTLPCRVVQKDNSYTSLAGYFIAGDARFEQDKLKLIHGATHDAMQASNAAYLYLNPNDTYQPIVSTHHPIFKDWNRH
ncbi:NAD(P)/FAD-dependent oxidoreductase [Solibacillus sp.]|uniref:NAD(P)/FAD-dependent oxidoreductase n=1 Tax=Solibacillus sp. TaxID=1909654 RepID=UPI0033159D8D